MHYLHWIREHERVEISISLIHGLDACLLLQIGQVFEIPGQQDIHLIAGRDGNVTRVIHMRGGDNVRLNVLHRKLLDVLTDWQLSQRVFANDRTQQPSPNRVTCSFELHHDHP
jgi:hypothetical protein